MWRKPTRYSGGRALSLPWMALIQFTQASVEEFCCLGLLAAPPPSVFITPWYSSGKPSLPDFQNIYFTCCWLYSGLWPGELQGLSQGWARDSTKSQWEPCSGLQSKILSTSHLASEREDAIWEWHQRKGKQSWEMQEIGPADTVWATGPRLVQSQDIPRLSSYRPQ